MGKSEEQDPCSFVAQDVVLSYPHLFKPQSMKGTNNDPKFSATFLVDKESNVSPIKKAIRAAKTKKWGPKEDWKPCRSPIVDGDEPEFEDKEGYAGNWIIKGNAPQDRRPVLVDQKNRPVVEPSAFYPGCVVHASLYAFVWEFPENSGKFGVSFTLDGVQKVKDSKPFGGRKAADKVFAPIESDEDEDSDDEDDEEHDFR